MRESSLRAASRRGGYSLLEVIIAMAVLLAGVVGVMQLFPPTLDAANRASLTSKAALLAQQKAEEIRRDRDQQASIITEIENLTAPTTLTPFPNDDRLAYQYHSRSVLDPVDDPGDPRDDFGVARVIVRYNPAFRPSDEVLFEMRFDR